MCVITIADSRAAVYVKMTRTEMFTAYDITKKVRENNPDLNIQHDEVRHIVQDMFTNGEMDSDYTRSLINLPGISVQPWLYHHQNDNPQDYLTNFQILADNGLSNHLPSDSENVLSQVVDPLVVIPVDNSLSQNNSQKVCVVTKAGRLTIPGKMLREMGYYYGWKVKVWVDMQTKSLTILAATSPIPTNNNQFFWEYEVSKKKDIRICTKLLKRISDKKTFIITQKEDCLTITEAVL